MKLKRSGFLAAGGAAALAGAAGSPAVGHEEGQFLAPHMSDAGTEHLWHGYPNECSSFSTFVDSLVALAWGHGWGVQAPYVSLRNAVMVDFASATEQEAAASLARGWNGAWEFPMGTAATVAKRVEINSQNAKLWRQLAIIGTAMSSEEFHARVIEPLLDSRSCQDSSCSKCVARGQRHLEDVFIQLALGTEQKVIQLFSLWKPSAALKAKAHAAGIEIIHHSLHEIPKEDLEANRAYHIWDGTPLQADVFRKNVWAPAWRRGKRTLVADGR